jgi:hypothetical protein
MKITSLRLAAALAVAIVLGEGLVQLSGAVDIPVYEANNQIGYIPAPLQSGSFLHIHDYRFNELSMGAGPFNPDPKRFNVLLVGDSLVLGGNPLSEPERLGPQLEELTGWQVWPISAGSWALQNELTYIRQHQNILEKMDAVIILSNSSDFDEPSSWASGLTHPRRHPFPGLLFMLEKYVFGEPPQPVPTDLKVAKRDWRVDLRHFSETFNKPIYLFLYPGLDEMQDKSLLEKRLNVRIPELHANLEKNAGVLKVADHPQWVVANYRDGVHPNGHGNAVLAKIFLDDMCQTPIEKMNCK